jgi:hypothetical protein
MKRFSTAVLLPALLGLASAGEASDLELGAYIRVPFGNGGTVFGLSARPKLYDALAQESHPASDSHETGLHFQAGPEKAPVVMLNGVSLSRLRALNQNAGSAKAEKQGVDWYLVAGVAVGVGLLALAFSSDDVTVTSCSGPNCPPSKPEPDPEPVE